MSMSTYIQYTIMQQMKIPSSLIPTKDCMLETKNWADFCTNNILKNNWMEWDTRCYLLSYLKETYDMTNLQQKAL